MRVHLAKKCCYGPAFANAGIVVIGARDIGSVSLALTDGNAQLEGFPLGADNGVTDRPVHTPSQWTKIFRQFYHFSKNYENSHTG
jgi:hypothetical protein